MRCTEDAAMSKERRKKCQRRRHIVTSPLFWTNLLLLWWESPVEFSEQVLSRRRLSQLLRGAISNDSSIRHEQSSATLSNTTTVATVPLHATTGTHHVYVYIGSPPQRQTLIVDTGSRLLAFPCHPCRGCGRHASKFYNHELSTTDVIPKCGSCYLNVSKCSDFTDRCILSQKYTEGSSWTAFETEDIVWFGSLNAQESVEDLMQLAVPYTFGCQTSEKGLFRKQYADGILGLAMHETSLVQAMYQAGAIESNAFSLCFTRSGGYMSLGGTFTDHHLEQMKFSNISRDHGWYSLKVEAVSVGNISVVNSHTLEAFATGKGTILDSGTTDTFLPKVVAPELASVWKDWSGLDYSNEPRFYTLQEFEQLPDVTITFAGNVTLTITPESYMEGVPASSTGDMDKARPFWKGKHQLTNRLYADEPLGAVLGANSMFGHDILFDSQEHRVGLARANCYAATDISTIQ